MYEQHAWIVNWTLSLCVKICSSFNFWITMNTPTIAGEWTFCFCLSIHSNAFLVLSPPVSLRWFKCQTAQEFHSTFISCVKYYALFYNETERLLSSFTRSLLLIKNDQFHWMYERVFNEQKTGVAIKNNRNFCMRVTNFLPFVHAQISMISTSCRYSQISTSLSANILHCNSILHIA